MRYNLRSRVGVPESPPLSPSGSGPDTDSNKSCVLTSRRRRRSPYRRPPGTAQTTNAEPPQANLLLPPSAEAPPTIRLWWPLVGAGPPGAQQPSTPSGASFPRSPEPSRTDCAGPPSRSGAVSSGLTAAGLTAPSGQLHLGMETGPEAAPRSIGLSAAPARSTDTGALPREERLFGPAPECPSETSQVKTRDVMPPPSAAEDYNSRQSGGPQPDHCVGGMAASPVKPPVKLVLPSPATTPSLTQCRKRRRISLIDPSSGLPTNGTPGTANSNLDVPFLSSSTRTTSATSPPSTDPRSDPSPRRSRPSQPLFPSPKEPACHVTPDCYPSLPNRSSFVGAQVPDPAPHQERSPTAVQASVPERSESPGWFRADPESRVRVASSHLDTRAKGQCRCGEQTAEGGPVVRGPPQPTTLLSRRSDESSAARAPPPSGNGGLTGDQPKTVQENGQPPSTTDRGSIHPQALFQGRGSGTSPEGEGAARDIQSGYITDGIVPLHCPATAAARELRRHSPLGNGKLTRCPMRLCAGQQAPCGHPCDRSVPRTAAATNGPTVSVTRPTRACNAPQGAQAESRHESAVHRQDDSVGDRRHLVSKCPAATTGHITLDTDGPASKSARPGRINTSENMGSEQTTLRRPRSPSEQPQPSGTHEQGSPPICASSSFVMAPHAESLLFSELPPAVLCMILRFLPTTSVNAFGATCRYAHALTQLPASWSYLEDSTVGNIFRLEKEGPNARKNHPKIKGLKMLTERFTGVTKLAIDLTSVISSSRRSCHQTHHETSAAALLSPALLRLHTTRLASEDRPGAVIARQRNDGGRPRPAFRRSAGEGPEVGDEIAETQEGVRLEADTFILLHGLLGDRRFQLGRDEGQSLRPNQAPSSVDEPSTQVQGRRRRSAELELLANQNAAVEPSPLEAEQSLQGQHPRTSGPSHVPERSVTGDLTPERRRGAEREGAIQEEADARGNSGEHLSYLRRALRGLHDEVSHTRLQVVTAQPTVPGEGAAHHGAASGTGEFGSARIQREVRSPQGVMDGQPVYPESSQPANAQQNSGSHCPDQLLPAEQNEATLANPGQTTRLSFTPPQSEGPQECQPVTLEAQRGRRMSPSREQSTFQGPGQHEQGPLSGRGIHESQRLSGPHISAVPLLVLVPAAFSENTASDGPEQGARQNQVEETGGERRREQAEDRDRHLVTAPRRGVTGSRDSEREHHPISDRIRTERQQLLLLHQLLVHLQQQRREQQRDERPQRPPSTLWGGLPSGSGGAVHLQSLRVPAPAGMHAGDAPETTPGRQTVPTQQCHEAAEGRERRGPQWQQEEGPNEGSRRSGAVEPPSRDSAPGRQWQLSPDGMVHRYESHARQNEGGLTGQPWPLVVERTSESAQGVILQGRPDDLTTTTHQGVGGSTRLEEQTQGTRLRDGSPLPSSSNAEEREVSFFGQPTLVTGDGGSVPPASEPVEEIVHPPSAASLQQSQRDVPLSRDRERSVTPAATVLGQELFGESVRQQRGGSQRRQLLLLPFLFASQFPLAFARQGEELTVVAADHEDAVHSAEARPRDRSLSQRQQQSSQLFGRRGGAFSRLLLGPRPTASTPTSAGTSAVKPALLRALFGGLRQLMQLTLKLEAREALQLPQLSLQLDLVKGLLQQNAQTLRVIKVSVELPVDTDVSRPWQSSAERTPPLCPRVFTATFATLLSMYLADWEKLASKVATRRPFATCQL